MSEPYLVKCIDAKYDAEDEMLVLLCESASFNGARIICFHRSDFNYKGKPVVPEEEMHKTADLWRGKRFNMVIEDDPARLAVDEDKYRELFYKKLEDESPKIWVPT